MTKVLIYSAVFAITEVKTTAEYQELNINHSQARYELTELRSSDVSQMKLCSRC